MANQNQTTAKISSFLKKLSKKDTVFLDCGANDGCSAIKFLSLCPTAKVLSFEPNKNLSHYHKYLPNTLVSCAVGVASGTVELIIDTIDGDGSTIITNKRVDATGNMKNDECPKVVVDSIDIACLISNIRAKGAILILKLDVEGAEYSIIDRLSREDCLKHISDFYCEFHWDRIGMSEQEHLAYLDLLNSNLCNTVKDWDASDWMLNHLESKARRDMYVKRIKRIVKIYIKKYLVFIFPLQKI